MSFRVNSNFRFHIVVKKENLAATLESLLHEGDEQQQFMTFPALIHGFPRPDAIQTTPQLPSQATRKLLTQENTARTASELVSLLSHRRYISHLDKWVSTKQS